MKKLLQKKILQNIFTFSSQKFSFRENWIFSLYFSKWKLFFFNSECREEHQKYKRNANEFTLILSFFKDASKIHNRLNHLFI